MGKCFQPDCKSPLLSCINLLILFVNSTFCLCRNACKFVFKRHNAQHFHTIKKHRIDIHHADADCEKQTKNLQKMREHSREVYTWSSVPHPATANFSSRYYRLHSPDHFYIFTETQHIRRLFYSLHQQEVFLWSSLKHFIPWLLVISVFLYLIN